MCVWLDSGKVRNHPGGPEGCPFIKRANGDLTKAKELSVAAAKQAQKDKQKKAKPDGGGDPQDEAE